LQSNDNKHKREGGNVQEKQKEDNKKHNKTNEKK
jgi:hypothetical protein